jgi:hypothetical protein
MLHGPLALPSSGRDLGLGFRMYLLRFRHDTSPFLSPPYSHNDQSEVQDLHALCTLQASLRDRQDTNNNRRMTGTRLLFTSVRTLTLPSLLDGCFIETGNLRSVLFQPGVAYLQLEQ